MTNKEALKIVTMAVEKLLFGSGECFSKTYIKRCDRAIYALSQLVEEDEKTKQN